MDRSKKQMKKAKQLGMSNIEIARMKAIAKRAAEDMEQRAAEKAFLYTLSIPLIILFNDYWPKTAKKKGKKFIEDVASLYQSVEMGIVTEQQLADELYDLAGVKLEAVWMQSKEGADNERCGTDNKGDKTTDK